MPAIIRLKDVIDALDMQSDEWRAYLNPETGEIVTVSDEDYALLDDDVDPEDLPEWQREELPKMKAAIEAIENNKLLPLPDKFEIHEWDIMRRFADDRDDEAQRRELASAIHGRGAFRMFRDCLHRLAIADEWYRFRDAAMEQIAKEWLKDHGITYR